MGLLFNRTFFRILSKNREIYVLKLVCLTVAFFSCILIALFSVNEFTFDGFHFNHKRVFRIIERNESANHNGNRLSNRIPADILKVFRNDFAGSAIFSRVKLMKGVNLEVNGTVFLNEKVYAADREIHEVLSFNMIERSGDYVDSIPNVFVSNTMAKKLFQNSSAIGQQLKLFTDNDSVRYRITAVFSEMPDNSHEKIDILIPYFERSIRLLGFDSESNAVYGRHLTRTSELRLNRPPHNYYAQSIEDIHFGPRVLGEDAVHGDRYSITILIFIVSMILVLALSTYTNLTTLILPNRAKEFAVRKLGGSSQSQLLVSFATESAIFVFVAIGLAVVGLAFAQSEIKSSLQIDLLQMAGRYWLPMAVLLLALCMLFVMGPIFIAYYFATASPSRLLNSSSIAFPKFKRVIIFIQLAVSMFLIVVSVVTRRQVLYSLVKEPGQSNDQILYLAYPPSLTYGQLIDLRTNWSNAHMIDVIATSHIPGHVNSKDLHTGFYTIRIEPGFKDFFNLQMVSGSWFKANDGDSIAVVNERAGSEASMVHANTIGIFHDLSHQFDLPERPTMLSVGTYRPNYLCVKVLEVDIRRSQEFLENYFSENGRKPKVSFLNQRFEQWVKYQDQLNKISIVLTTVALIVSCCAIYALTISFVRDNLKQIAIHKLCGANNLNLTRILTREFAFQTMMVALLAGPVAYLVIKELLREFVYATQVTLLDFTYPVVFVTLTVIILSVLQILTINRSDLTSSLKA